MRCIRTQFALCNETCGVPGIYLELQKEGVTADRHCTVRLMRDNDLNALRKFRFQKATDSNQSGLIATKLLDQDFSCDGPDKK